MHSRRAIATIASLLACMMLQRTAADAQEKAEPVVYLFWSASCPYSKLVRTFLDGAKAKDAALALRDFEIDQSLANNRLLERLYAKIGLPGARIVPTIVIGHQIIVGYIDDRSTGKDILSAVEECRRAVCKDAVKLLIEAQDRLDADMTSAPPPRVVCGKEPGREVQP